jgi:hypothetical protein
MSLPSATGMTDQQKINDMDLWSVIPLPKKKKKGSTIASRR